MVDGLHGESAGFMCEFAGLIRRVAESLWKVAELSGEKAEYTFKGDADLLGKGAELPAIDAELL